MDLKPREIIGQIKAKFNIKVSYMKAWDARRKALKTVFGSWEESYRTINLFMDAIVFSMPETIYKIQSSENHGFEKLFFSFGPSINGWSYYRPVLCLDGTFLLGKYRGTLLTAVGIDANNGLYPLAFAIVESECVDSWVWFLNQLHVLLPVVSTRPDLCIIFDRHAGLVRGCREIFPNAAHRHFLRHLRENLKKELLCQKMYMAGNTDDPMVFDRCMKDMIKVKADIHQWLVERDVTSWALTYDGGFRYGVMTTNASESFNGVLKRARGLPIQALVSFRVDLINNENCICSCGKSIIFHIPCAHIVTCISMLRKIHYNYVSKYYSLDNYKMTYVGQFHNIPDRTTWAQHDPSSGIHPLLPPNFRRRSGRPRTNRFRNTMDEGRGSSNRKCAACDSVGHNKAACPTRSAYFRLLNVLSLSIDFFMQCVE
ncbi:Protein FAR1-RELATED SEQUENCE 8 [Dendrobium catenatum]|uniref:Protein FAR1-RELATED SEQUENCE 8 n=1 Tax=Dendrobium catenatum TaxID=906689 RepID=A0A2I0WG06_9ASPA|nr:Protein FAR1-RELATED SEQUENCE 8 [Dendrobium catenatum]